MVAPGLNAGEGNDGKVDKYFEFVTAKGLLIQYGVAMMQQWCRVWWSDVN